nr:hypothetical protein [Pseudoclavibacter chungangensis]
MLGRLLVHEIIVARTGVDRPIRAACATCGEEHGRPVVAELCPPGPGATAPGATGLDVTRLDVARLDVPPLDASDPGVTGLGVSIAHAGSLVVVAVGAGRVGIDAERAGATIPRDFARDVRGWTRLEAVLKADGRGFDADPARARIGRTTGTLDGIRYALADIATVPGVVTSVAWEAPPRRATRRTGRRGGAR